MIVPAQSSPTQSKKKSLLSSTDPPEGVQFQAGEETVCSGTTITFQCSVADANPRKLTYQLYENNVMISSGSTGVWKREMTAGGVLPYNCVVTNMIGTTMSTNISVSVNGNYCNITPLF